MRATVFFLAFALSSSLAAAQTRTAKTLDIYVVDVEGGNATLLVSPSGESLLIDTGNTVRRAVRDAERIMAAAKDAGLKQIDHLIITHWHGDHFGGLAELAARIPIRDFIDHGPNVQPAEAVDEFLQKTYPALYGKAKHTVAKPGDKIADGRSRRAGGDLGGRDHQDAAAGRRQTESVLRELQARRKQRRRSAIGREPHHVWQVPRASPGRSDHEQGIRADVSE